MLPAPDTILLVEDDENSRDALTDILQESGYRVVAARDGLEAMELLHSEPPDLVLSDIVMPRRDGFRLITEVRDYSETIPVIFMSGLGEQRQRMAGLEAGADDYLVKPLDVGELLARVRSHLRRAQVHGQTPGEQDRDELTGAHNLRGITEALARELARCRRSGAALSVLALEVVAFQQLASDHGQTLANTLLHRVTATLAASMRAHDLLGRVRADGFVLVLPETNSRQALQLADRITRTCRAEVRAGPRLQVLAEITVGTATASRHDTADSLLQRAQAALPLPAD